MRCVAVLLMSGYEQNQAGINLTGIFDKIFLAEFPGTVSVIPLFIRLIADEFEFGNSFVLRADLVDQDGQSLASKTQQYTVPKRGEPHEVMNMIWDFPNVAIQQPGLFDLNVFVDNELVNSHALQIVLRGGGLRVTLPRPQNS